MRPPGDAKLVVLAVITSLIIIGVGGYLLFVAMDWIQYFWYRGFLRPLWGAR